MPTLLPPSSFIPAAYSKQVQNGRVLSEITSYTTCLSPCGRYALTGGDGGWIAVYDLRVEEEDNNNKEEEDDDDVRQMDMDVQQTATQIDTQIDSNFRAICKVRREQGKETERSCFVVDVPLM